jgi:hypothetical protein
MRQIERVKGPRSYRIAVTGRWVLALWVAVTIGLGATVALRPESPESAYFGTFFAVLGVWLVVDLVIGALVVLLQLQGRRERRAGYTWLKDKYQNLDQIDPVSYVVIRQAGEPFLADDHYAEQVARARSWAKQHR